jgi:hypothetical protein
VYISALQILLTYTIFDIFPNPFHNWCLSPTGTLPHLMLSFYISVSDTITYCLILSQGLCLPMWQFVCLKRNNCSRDWLAFHQTYILFFFRRLICIPHFPGFFGVRLKHMIKLQPVKSKWKWWVTFSLTTLTTSYMQFSMLSFFISQLEADNHISLKRKLKMLELQEVFTLWEKVLPPQE